MKLTTKLVLALLAGVLLLLAVDGYLSVRREIALFERDMEWDARSVGLAMQGMIAHLWELDQRQRALVLIDEVNRHSQTYQVHWAPADSLPGRPRLAELIAEIDKESEETPIRSIWMDDGGSALHTYVPVHGRSGELFGVVEISESRADLNHYVRATVLRRLILVTGLLLISATVVLLVGFLIVGRPLEKLIAGTRCIAGGDLTAKVHLSGHDELDELADAMNTMVERLRASRDELEAETTRRIAAIEELRHVDRLRTVGRLASGVAHELGTPLNVVSGRASMLEDGGSSAEEITEGARIIRAQADRMTRIVRQLLDFARRPRTERGPVDLQRCASEVRGLLEPFGSKRRITLVLEEVSDSPLVTADRSQIEQVLTNLVMNAIHASPDGGRIELAVGSESADPPPGHEGSSGRHAFIRIRDRGAGVPEENMQHLFEPFFTTKDVGEGTGLGLSVAYNIVQDHGGWIAVRNRPGGGAEFTVCLPEAQGHDG